MGMATETTTTTVKSTTWPYTSWKSLLNVIDRFKEHGLPPRIDRSVLGGSEGQKTQIIAALRFFGLVKDNGDVNERLTRIVNASDKERQQIVRELLAAHYPKATELAAVNATTKQLEETFTGIGGDTMRKAVGFYLGAAKYSGHPVSKHFKVPSFIARSSGTRRQSTVHDDHSEEQSQPMDDPKARYLEMLMERAKSADGQLDEKLLDRIEKLLGYQGGGESNE